MQKRYSSPPFLTITSVLQRSRKEWNVMKSSSETFSDNFCRAPVKINVHWSDNHLGDEKSAFHLNVDSNSRLFLIYITALSNWLKETRATFTTNLKPNSWPAHRHTHTFSCTSRRHCSFFCVSFLIGQSDDFYFGFAIINRKPHLTNNQSESATRNWWQARENTPNYSAIHPFVGEFGSRDGAVVKALASYQCSPGSISARCRVWVEFVVGSRLAPRVYLWVLWFSSLYKNQHYKLQFDQDRGPGWKPARADVASSLNIVIYLRYIKKSPRHHWIWLFVVSSLAGRIFSRLCLKMERLSRSTRLLKSEKMPRFHWWKKQRRWPSDQAIGFICVRACVRACTFMLSLESQSFRLGLGALVPRV